MHKYYNSTVQLELKELSIEAISNFIQDKLAEFVGASHAVACSNGTAALHLAMLALDVGPKDAILTTPNTFLAVFIACLSVLIQENR